MEDKNEISKLKVVVECDKDGSDDSEINSDADLSRRSSHSTRVQEGSAMDLSSDKNLISAPDPVSTRPLGLVLPMVKSYENKGVGEFVSGFDPTSAEYKEKQEMRQKRFGEMKEVLTEEVMKRIYDSLDVREAEAAEDGVRLDALHIHGVNDLSTQKVFQYFREFAPNAIEWIDDSSCNVVWLDKISPLRALFKLTRSKSDAESDTHSDAEAVLAGTDVRKDDEEKMEDDDELNLLSEEDVAKLGLMTVTAEQHKQLNMRREGDEPQKMETDSDEDEDEDDDNKAVARRRPRITRPVADKTATEPSVAPTAHSTVPWPEGLWRLGRPHPQAKWLFLRFATKADKKQRGAGRHSEYYRKYGNPSFGGMKGLISGSRRRQMAVEQQHKEITKTVEPDSDEVNKSVEVALDEQELDIKETVSKRRKTSESESSESSDAEYRPKEPKYRMRMHADDIHLEARSATQRLGGHRPVQSRLTVPPSTTASTDLRSRLGRKRRN